MMIETTVTVETFENSLIISAPCPICKLMNIGVSENRGMIRSGQEIKMRHQCDHWKGWGSGEKGAWFFFEGERAPSEFGDAETVDEIFEKVVVMVSREDGFKIVNIAKGGLFPQTSSIRKIPQGDYLRNSKGTWYQLHPDLGTMRKLLYQRLMEGLVQLVETDFPR